jgi:hypothetical protein
MDCYQQHELSKHKYTGVIVAVQAFKYLKREHPRPEQSASH